MFDIDISGTSILRLTLINMVTNFRLALKEHYIIGSISNDHRQKMKFNSQGVP